MGTDTSPPILFLKLSEVAHLFRVSRRSVDRWVATGRLRAITLPSGRRMVPTAALRDLVVASPSCRKRESAK